MSNYPTQTDNPAEATTYNGYKNYETWNVSLWIGNDEFLYQTAKACVIYCKSPDTPWSKFVRCMMNGTIGRHLLQTGDGVSWDNPKIDVNKMNEMMRELAD